MKFIPRHNQIIGRTAIQRSDSKIILVDESKVTKYVFVDAVSAEAAAAGVKAGDVIVPSTVMRLVLDGGMVSRPILDEIHAIFHVTETDQDRFLVQTENGKEFVPFDAPNAAKSLGQNAPEKEPDPTYLDMMQQAFDMMQSHLPASMQSHFPAASKKVES